MVRGLAYYTGIVFECFDRRGVSAPAEWPTESSAMLHMLPPAEPDCALRCCLLVVPPRGASTAQFAFAFRRLTASSRLQELRAICGGGRYDRLLSLYGSPKDEAGEYKWTVPWCDMPCVHSCTVCPRPSTS